MLKLSPTIAMDISEAAFERAVGMLEASPSAVTLLCSADCAALAFRIEQKYGCKTVLLPNEIMKSQFHWAVRTDSATVWCPGI